MDSYKVTKRAIYNKETGSCFDRTSQVSGDVRPGGHIKIDQKINVSAFSFAKETRRKVRASFFVFFGKVRASLFVFWLHRACLVSRARAATLSPPAERSMCST